jgi:triosephosphate isomerase
MRKPLIVANWKMHNTASEASSFVEELLGKIGEISSVEVAIAPPFTALESVSKILSKTDLALAAQNMYWEPEGAFTGEISPVMLRELDCRFVILGHSERRQYFGDGDGEVALKVGAALTEGLMPILCVGETLGEREQGKTFEIVERQVRSALDGGMPDSGGGLVIAYEPVWAIGTGKTATPEAAQEVHGFIRGLLENLLGEGLGDEVRILYGGSVKPDSVNSLMAMQDIDGALVGGASLDAESFARIIHFK